MNKIFEAYTQSLNEDKYSTAAGKIDKFMHPDDREEFFDIIKSGDAKDLAEFIKDAEVNGGAGRYGIKSSSDYLNLAKYLIRANK
jgi:hypothetical protein